MFDTIYELTNQLKLKNLIIENFVPPEEYKKYEAQTVWNETENDWVINHPAKKMEEKKKIISERKAHPVRVLPALGSVAPDLHGIAETMRGRKCGELGALEAAKEISTDAAQLDASPDVHCSMPYKIDHRATTNYK